MKAGQSLGQGTDLGNNCYYNEDFQTKSLMMKDPYLWQIAWKAENATDWTYLNIQLVHDANGIFKVWVSGDGTIDVPLDTDIKLGIAQDIGYNYCKVYY